MSRADYLEKFWPSYPAMPAEARTYGRLHGLDAASGRLQVIRDGRVFSDQFLSLIGAPAGWNLPQMTSYLRVGDLIAVGTTGDLTLLAPVLSEGKPVTANRETLQRWSQFLVEVRAYFMHAGFSEIMTPGLVVCPGTEPSLDVFPTEFVSGSRRQIYYLPTSPELHLKKALGAGWDQIFEIKSCYRNGEITDRHQPEFTLLEWYRAWSIPEKIQQDVLGLIAHLTEKFSSEDVKSPLRLKRTSMKELFQSVLNEKITPESTIGDYREMAQRHGLAVSADHTIDDLFFLLFSEKIETQFDSEELVIVEDWPPFQAALARLTNEGWGDRFEIYWQGFELANAFHELNDPAVQKKRFSEDLAKKSAMGKPAIPLDEDFLRTLSAGLPPSAGIALGLERLFMAMFQIKRIQELKLFPWKN